jgi:hypothetical protein
LCDLSSGLSRGKGKTEANDNNNRNAQDYDGGGEPAEVQRSGQHGGSEYRSRKQAQDYQQFVSHEGAFGCELLPSSGHIRSALFGPTDASQWRRGKSSPNWSETESRRPLHSPG